MDNNKPEAETEQVVAPVEATPEDTSPVSQNEPPAEQPIETAPEQLPEDKSEQGRAFQEMRHKIAELERQVKPPEPQRPESVMSQMNFNTSDPNVAREVRQVLSEQKAWEKYPQLNPTSDKYDAKFAKKITKLAAMDIVERGEADIFSIAEEEASLYYGKPDMEKVKQEAEKQTKQALTEKEQAALTVTGNPPKKSNDDAEYEKIKYLSKFGTSEQKNWAMTERLKRAGI